MDLNYIKNRCESILKMLIIETEKVEAMSNTLEERIEKSNDRTSLEKTVESVYTDIIDIIKKIDELRKVSSVGNSITPC